MKRSCRQQSAQKVPGVSTSAAQLMQRGGSTRSSALRAGLVRPSRVASVPNLPVKLPANLLPPLPNAPHVTYGQL